MNLFCLIRIIPNDLKSFTSFLSICVYFFNDSKETRYVKEVSILMFFFFFKTKSHQAAASYYIIYTKFNIHILGNNIRWDQKNILVSLEKYSILNLHITGNLN